MKKVAVVALVALAALGIWQRKPIFYFVYDDLIVGRSQAWNGLQVEIDAPLYFVPPTSPDTLLIGARGEVSGLLELLRSPAPLQEVHVEMSAGCDPKQCSEIEEHAADLNGKRVVRLARAFKTGGDNVYRVVWWIDGSPVRMRYQGAEQAFPVFAPTAEGLLSSITRG